MADTKFTPGPWEWDAGLIPPDGPQRYADIYVDGGDKIIAEFNDCIPEGRANAHLIAAAPDLYAALAKALDDSGCDGDLCAYQWHETARAALSKARGEQ